MQAGGRDERILVRPASRRLAFRAELAAPIRSILQATTACLSAIVVMQVANVFLCRGERDSILDRNVPHNRYLWWAIATEIGLILLIVYTND